MQILYMLCRRFPLQCFSIFFFFNDTATTEIYTLSLHDALPISSGRPRIRGGGRHETRVEDRGSAPPAAAHRRTGRSEEHTSELQSHSDLVCRLLLEKKKKRDPKACAASRR